jgi:hypothetical protein
MISLKKSFEMAMKLSQVEDLLPLKQTMLVFCLAMQDLGVAVQSDNMTSILVKLQDIYIDKTCESMAS